jgi:hypothetical protein
MQIFTQINLVRKIPLHTRTKRIHCMDYSMEMLKRRYPFSRGTYPCQWRGQIPLISLGRKIVTSWQISFRSNFMTVLKCSLKEHVPFPIPTSDQTTFLYRIENHVKSSAFRPYWFCFRWQAAHIHVFVSHLCSHWHCLGCLAMLNSADPDQLVPQAPVKPCKILNRCLQRHKVYSVMHMKSL